MLIFKIAVNLVILENDVSTQKSVVTIKQFRDLLT